MKGENGLRWILGGLTQVIILKLARLLETIGVWIIDVWGTDLELERGSFNNSWRWWRRTKKGINNWINMPDAKNQRYHRLWLIYSNPFCLVPGWPCKVTWKWTRRCAPKSSRHINTREGLMWEDPAYAAGRLFYIVPYMSYLDVWMSLSWWNQMTIINTWPTCSLELGWNQPPGYSFLMGNSHFCLVPRGCLARNCSNCRFCSCSELMVQWLEEVTGCLTWTLVAWFSLRTGLTGYSSLKPHNQG